jgi:hypothetical protein
MTPEQELASIRAQRTAIAKDREQRAEGSRVRDAIAEERRLLALEEATVKAEADHGPLNRKVAIVHARRADDSIAGSVIVRRPNAQLWKRYQHTKTEGAKASSDELDKLFGHCVVFPPTSEFEELFEEFPGMSVQLLSAISKLAGFRIEEVSGK